MTTRQDPMPRRCFRRSNHKENSGKAAIVIPSTGKYSGHAVQFESLEFKSDRGAKSRQVPGISWRDAGPFSIRDQPALPALHVRCAHEASDELPHGVRAATGMGRAADTGLPAALAERRGAREGHPRVPARRSGLPSSDSRARIRRAVDVALAQAPRRPWFSRGGITAEIAL